MTSLGQTTMRSVMVFGMAETSPMPVIIVAILPIRLSMTEIIMVLAKQWSKLEQMVWAHWIAPFILIIIVILVDLLVKLLLHK